MRNNDVALLQKELMKLDYIISDKELQKSFYGKSTFEAVKKFQLDNNIGSSGIVDETTANVLTKIILQKQNGDGESSHRRISHNPKAGDNITMSLQDNNKSVLMNASTKQPQIAILKNQSFILKPNVLFGNLSDLNKLKDGNSKTVVSFILSKLNEQFHAEIIKTIGTVSNSLAKEIQTVVYKLDYEQFKDSEVSAVIIENVLAELKKNSKKEKDLAKEISEIKTHITNTFTKIKVRDLLYLNVPLQQNPIFANDIQTAKIHEYSKLVNLNTESITKLLEKKLFSDSIVDEMILSDSVKEGIIDDKQKKDLLLTISLGNLTGDNLSLIKAVKTHDMKSIADIASWDLSNWQQLITDENIPLHPNETAESYAKNIFFNIQMTFPSQNLLSRITDPHFISSKVNLVDSLNNLLVNNNKLIDGVNPAIIDWKGIGAENREKLQKDLQDITAFCNTYRRLGIVDLINDKEMDISAKKNMISDRIQLINTFYKNNPDVDLRYINFFTKKEHAEDNDSNGMNSITKKLNWEGISNTDQPIVRKQLMAYQRILNLTEDTDDKQRLLSKGFDSAMTISNETAHEFVKTSGLEVGKARMIYAKAQEYSLSVAHSFHTIHDSIRGQFKDIAMANLDSSLLVNDLRGIDGFSSFFGPQDFCDCKDCKSILGPAAYFVDLMGFIKSNISNIFFFDKPDHPLYLKKRRPDLWKLTLSCDNTNNLIPYLSVVNEVLQTYLDDQLSAVGNDKDIFEKMCSSSEKLSFSLPFSLPLEELRIYLSHFGITLHQIYKILKQSEDKIWRARIDISKEELFDVISKPDAANVLLRFGDSHSLSDDNVVKVESFIRLARISRQQLDDLLSVTFNTDLNNIIIIKEIINDELQNFPEKLNNLTNERLDVIHRFIRLWKKVPSWSISDLDLVLTSLKDAGLDTTELLDAHTVIDVAQLLHIQQELDLTVEELCAMFCFLPASKNYPFLPVKQEDKKLFERLFDLIKIFGEEDPSVHKLKKSTTFHHYSFNKVNPADRTIDHITPMLIAGLGVSETELLLIFDLLKKEILFDNNGDCTLDQERISKIYRHIRLAKALEFSIEDFIQALHLIFPDVASSSTGALPVTKIEQIHKLIEFRDWLKANSQFSVSNLRFILKGEENHSAKYKVNLEAVVAMVQEIQKPPQKTDSEKLDSLKQQYLPQYFNLSSNTLSNILKWTSINIDDDHIKAALSAVFDPTTHAPDNPLQLEPLLDLIRELERVVMLLLSQDNGLKFKQEAIDHITNKPEILGIKDPQSLAVKNLERLRVDDIKNIALYKKVIMSAEGAEDEAESSIYNILVNYHSAGGVFSTTTTASGMMSDSSSLAGLWKQDKSILDSLIGSLVFPVVAIEAVDYLWQCLSICNVVGINGFSLQKLADDSNVVNIANSPTGDFGFANLSFARDVALAAFTSKYDNEKIRKEKLEPYQDLINVKKRDALCDYIVASSKELKFRNLNEIYAFFLLDAEMSGCFRTSRIVCAISSLQLYIHRCLINAEQSNPDPVTGSSGIIVNFSENPEVAKEWEWRKNYRVWEANRKVFLYPENYLEPDLRDDKTFLFRDLEDELLQQEITEENAEAAYKKYVSDFAMLAGLTIAGAYYDYDSKTYYLFGRNRHDPPQYYYRKWINKKIWTSWAKITVSINSDRVASVISRGKLYIFWTHVTSRQEVKISNGNSEPPTKTYTKELMYSFLSESGNWIPVQKIPLRSIILGPNNSFDVNEMNNIIYPVVKDNKIYIFEKDKKEDGIPHLLGYLLIFLRNSASSIEDNSGYELVGPRAGLLFVYFRDPFAGEQIRWNLTTGEMYSTPDWEATLEWHERFGKKSIQMGTKLIKDSPYLEIGPPTLHLVGFGQGKSLNHFNPGNFILELPLDEHTFLIDDQISKIESPLTLIPIPGGVLAKKKCYRLTTSLVDELGEILFNNGLEAFMSLSTQLLKEHPMGIDFIQPAILSGPDDAIATHIDFQGAYGTYYQELFFHIPFLIANHLNATQKFKEANWWYERIFNPTSTEAPYFTIILPGLGTHLIPNKDRNWQYVEFRNIAIQKMIDILTNEEAIEKYKKDPFNPHAIARLRVSAYQKSIVMKYIDNLLDWGDYLFAQDTMESINEATMLYVLASSILGERPVKLGDCKTAEEEKLTYERIEAESTFAAIMGEPESDFLILLESFENWNWKNRIAMGIARDKIAINDQNDILSINNNGGNLSSIMNFPYFKPRYNVEYYTELVREKKDYFELIKDWENIDKKPIEKSPVIDFIKHKALAFCVPPNYDLLEYWNRVDDRLFKIRHCMNISGIQRQLPLFQPPINPMLLVRAKAAGLSLEKALEMDSVKAPPYRFNYIIEKAKQFAQSVQSFGSTFLSALEKKDVEELTLLRSVHERTILQLTREVKKQQIEEAKDNHQALVETKTNVQNRITYYQGLIETGLIKEEQTAENFKVTSRYEKISAADWENVSSFSYLIPQIGSPLAMTFGGRELGAFASAVARWKNTSSALSESSSSSSATEASFIRRAQDWRQLLKLAQQEDKQVEQQMLAAEIRKGISERDLENHEKNIEHTEELDDFYKNKFTNLGLYDYFSTTLSRLYREAYNVAYEMAKMAEAAYQFECDDESTTFIAANNWQFDHAGLLAGERLLLQLQHMESSYLKQYRRDLEVTQSFSLAMLNPSGLINLKQTGKSGDFQIPEVLYDLFYPGQYKRLIKSVRLTIPCVTGPFTNISATLTLKDSSCRKKPKLEEDLISIPNSMLPSIISIATSNGQNDSGMFELNFRDERYLPFEGAGAISKWQLELPDKIRSFDYDSISDVIIHVSYTAKYNGLLRDKVEDRIANTLNNVAGSDGLFRLISLKHEFPSLLYQLLHPLQQSDPQMTTLQLEKKHFPYFLISRTLTISSTKIYLKSKNKEPIETSSLDLKINDKKVGQVGGWTDVTDGNNSVSSIKQADVSLTGSPIAQWKINTGANSLNREKLDDLMILFKYTAS
jgi:Tc toxin complex TcA C-terminal TcB-binding domain/Neuraminidase-like domain/Salmonella virulence plasmid 28.1kDa A protein/Putative peptidoglycan binding domain